VEVGGEEEPTNHTLQEYKKRLFRPQLKPFNKLPLWKCCARLPGLSILINYNFALFELIIPKLREKRGGITLVVNNAPRG
jgi:hypothetical protein